jgi:putative ABC transport system substrate-binding protein
LIVATSGPAAGAAKRATTILPVVFVGLPAPVEQGLVASLARPGGNLTEISSQGLDLIGKRFELLKEAFPQITRVGYLPEPGRLVDELVVDELDQRAADRLGMQLTPAKVRMAEDIPAAMAALAHVHAWLISDAIFNYANRTAIIEQIAKQRKPAMYPSSLFTNLGGLMSYSVSQLDQFRRAAVFVDRILRGAKPADLPVEQPSKFDFVINLKTAKALGLTIPQSILLRADRVIE